MSYSLEERVRAKVDAVYREESRRIHATLIRLLGGDFDLAEDALHESFRAALEQWPRKGVPDNPRAWLVSTGRFKAIDAIRRKTRFKESAAEIVERLGLDRYEEAPGDRDTIEDDRLRLIFTCCHPALAAEARVALTMREVCGLTTEEIARAFLLAPSTLAQRIVRAKARIRDTGIPYQVPAPSDLPDRLETVLQVIYLIYNEGYSASAGDSLTRSDLSGEAIRLGRLLVQLMPQPDPEAGGLLAMMLLQESRREARTSSSGDIVLLEDQDRSLWNRDHIEEGLSIVNRTASWGQEGPYVLQAAIAAVHAQTSDTESTDWALIKNLYDRLVRVLPSPVVELNRAVAVAMCEGPATGLELVDSILERGELRNYHLAHAARADLCRRVGNTMEARKAYEQALALVRQQPEHRFLERRLAELG